MTRRTFLAWTTKATLAVATAATSVGTLAASAQRRAAPAGGASDPSAGTTASRSPATPLRLFLAGDVMTGRGIDQALPRSVDPTLREPWVRDARRYLELAEAANGPIDPPLAYDQVWGDTLGELRRAAPDARIVNLETSVTTSDAFWPDKGIHYRMHPGNVGLLQAARIDLCVLANNHVMDFGREGLRETLAVLDDADLLTVGAGLDHASATAPTVLTTDKGRLLTFAYGAPDAGVPLAWRAGAGAPGIAVLDGSRPDQADEVAAHVHAFRTAGDRVIVSLHWGSNWGYDVPASHRGFAHRLVDAGAADVVFGHSSHHPRGVEVYRDRLIVYGAGDYLNDYEGIGGHEAYRPDLTLMYLPQLADDGALVSLEMVPMRIRRLRLERARGDDARWLADTLDLASRPFGAGVRLTGDDRLKATLP